MSSFLSEETFFSAYLQTLQEAEDREIEFTVSAPSTHDEYVERVGFIRAIREARILFEETQRKFFPRT